MPTETSAAMLALARDDSPAGRARLCQILRALLADLDGPERDAAFRAMTGIAGCLSLAAIHADRLIAALAARP